MSATSAAIGRRPITASILTAAVGAAIWLAWEPHTADMAAQVYRAELAGRAGIVSWDGQWYGGHYMPAYSILMPLLGGLVGAWLAGALAAVAAAGVLAAIAKLTARGNRTAALVAGLLLTSGSLSALYSGRTTYLLGVAIGAGALLALMKSKPLLWVPLALLTPLASPVAALFLALCGTAILIGRRRWAGLVIAALALAPAVALSLAFPEGGVQPFSLWLLIPSLTASLVGLKVIPKDRVELRIGVGLYLLLCVGAFLVPSPVGGNVTRLGPLVAAAIAALIMIPARRRRMLILLLIPTVAWQIAEPAVDLLRTAGDRSTEASYYRPLIEALNDQASQPGRVEVVWTRSHWESALLAPTYALARGWERQLDNRFNSQVNGRVITPTALRNWIDGLAVHWVALPSAPIDFAAEGEAKLVRSGLPWLRPVWRSRDWQLFKVVAPTTVATGAATATALNPRSVDLIATRSGSALVRVRYNRLWRLEGISGCVKAGANGMTEIQIRSVGRGSLRLDGSIGSAATCGR